jgi:hypothetical protein
LRNAIGRLIDKSGYKNTYIAARIGMRPNHFSVKKQRGTWNEEEMEKILEVIENEELEDYFMGMLMQELEKDETVSLDEMKKGLGWK